VPGIALGRQQDWLTAGLLPTRGVHRLESRVVRRADFDRPSAGGTDSRNLESAASRPAIMNNLSYHALR
jgi:hypothetical protein